MTSVRVNFANLLCFTILFCGVLSSGNAAELRPENAREVVATFIENVDSYAADFTQTLLDERGNEQEVESGRLWLQRPGMFRWEYTDPWERLIVADKGGKIWLYDSELDQVTVSTAGEMLLQSPAALLVGDLSALDDYDISAEEDAEATVVMLAPRSARGDFEFVALEFDQGDLVKLILQDRFNQRTVVRLTEISRNPQLDSSLFVFEVPEGADLIDQSVN